MQFRQIKPIAELQKYIGKVWVFESGSLMPADDIKLVVPNGRMRLLIPFKNGIAATIDETLYQSKEGLITLTGIVDIPSRPELGPNTGTIGIEFNPIGAYRFFSLRFSDINNKIIPINDLAGKMARELQEQISNAETVDNKLALLQQFLLKKLLLKAEDAIFEYCIDKITATKGKITVKELEKKTGYSSRWLNIKFTEQLGISPKSLSSIIRFKQYYNAVANNKETEFLKNDLYDYYYDQAHFLKDFKRFTGHSHHGFYDQPNIFGKLFYRD